MFATWVCSVDDPQIIKTRGAIGDFAQIHLGDDGCVVVMT
jgi:hypothetical protein